jgi:hypothetical protein
MELVIQYAPVFVLLFIMLNNEQNMFIFKTSTIILIHVEGCTHFSWTTYMGGTCWMKTGAVSKNDAISTSDPTAVCGLP